MTPYYADDAVTIYHGDALEILPTITAADVVLADPPYTFGISSTTQGSAKGGGWADLMNSARFYASVLSELRRVVSHRDGAAWVFNSWRSFPVLARASYEALWAIESLMVWDKGPELGFGTPKGLRTTYELVALFTTPNFHIVNRSLPDVWRVPWGGSAPRLHHEAEKPISLLTRLIEISTQPGDLVLDPFTGSGSALLAAKLAGRRAVGIEMEERYCEIAAKRCSQEALGLSFLPTSDVQTCVQDPLPLGEEVA